MPLFAFKSNNHFVTSSDGAILQVHELTKSSDHLSSIHKSDWKKIATISPGLDDDDDDIDSKATDDMSYNGLLFFDGHGRIKGRIALTMLAQHLKQLHLLVSPEGYCFQEVSEIGTYPDFGIHYLRLNDLFSWPRHEVDLVTINVWSRLELTYSLPKYKNTTSTTIIGGRVNKEKYAELEKLVKEKDKELEKLKELKKKKDEEDEEKAQRIEELEKLNEDLAEELEQCQKLSWAILPSTKFVPQSADAREMHLTRRQRCPPEKLSCNPQLSFPHVFNSPKLVDKMYIWSSNNVKLVDEENSTAWPPPPTIDMRVGAGVQDFDKNDWWYVKTTHPEGGLTMLVYYDGKRSQISLYNNSVPLPLPFTKGAVEFTTHTYNFSFFDLPPLGMRLGFTYRP
ncbi:hypothetical protein LINPERHAP2_LOCUS37028 [Linum perenne]